MLPSLRCYLLAPFTTVVLVFINCRLQKYYILGMSEHEHPLWIRGGFKRLPGRPVPSMHRKARTYPPPRIFALRPYSTASRSDQPPFRLPSVAHCDAGAQTVRAGPASVLSNYQDRRRGRREGAVAHPPTLRRAAPPRHVPVAGAAAAGRPRCAMSVVGATPNLRGVFLLVVADDAESHLMAVFPMRKGEVIM
ncbi:hypothetical protein C8R47DRAFT_1200184 [Mycena vitilis]|nr:hypothetical protein C8R47DRAFT_1200184 [Mycena vitilis]